MVLGPNSRTELMDNVGRQIAFIQRKIDHMDNDLTKRIIFDALHKRRHGDNPVDQKGNHAEYKELFDKLRKDYKDAINALRKQQKDYSKQLDLEEEIKKVHDKQYHT